eukprot:SAG31_NODE_352_length_17229_cov_9.658669_8_plen_131_part_00
MQSPPLPRAAPAVQPPFRFGGGAQAARLQVVTEQLRPKVAAPGRGNDGGLRESSPVPIIDLTDVTLASPTGAGSRASARAQIATAIGSACRGAGFFIVVGHRIDPGKGLLSRFCANYWRNTGLFSRDVTH